MDKVVFVFGAGASYGAYRARTEGRATGIRTPPLTATLFQGGKILSNTTKAVALINLIEQARLEKGKSFDLESSLAKLASSKTPERLAQLVDLRFSVHAVIRDGAIAGWASNPRKTSTLYEDLWYRVKEQFGSIEARFVNMNYDTMLDRGIQDSEAGLDTFESYLTNDNWKLYHPHGSISWGYQIPDNVATVSKRAPLVEAVLGINLEELELKKAGSMFPTETDMVKNMLVPAIALPLAGSYEKELFVSPKEHVESMKRECRNSCVLVLIGWRAMDNHILDILNSGEDTTREVHIASGTEDGARAIQSTLETAGYKADKYITVGGGFEGYLKSPAFSAIFPNPAL